MKLYTVCVLQNNNNNVTSKSKPYARVCCVLRTKEIYSSLYDFANLKKKINK